MFQGANPEANSSCIATTGRDSVPFDNAAFISFAVTLGLGILCLLYIELDRFVKPRRVPNGTPYYGLGARVIVRLLGMIMLGSCLAPMVLFAVMKLKPAGLDAWTAAELECISVYQSTGIPLGTLIPVVVVILIFVFNAMRQGTARKLVQSLPNDDATLGDVGEGMGPGDGPLIVVMPVYRGQFATMTTTEVLGRWRGRDRARRANAGQVMMFDTFHTRFTAEGPEWARENLHREAEMQAGASGFESVHEQVASAQVLNTTGFHRLHVETGHADLVIMPFAFQIGWVSDQGAMQHVKAEKKRRRGGISRKQDGTVADPDCRAGQLLAEAARVLKPGGTMCLSIFSFHSKAVRQLLAALRKRGVPWDVDSLTVRPEAHWLSFMPSYVVTFRTTRDPPQGVAAGRVAEPPAGSDQAAHRRAQRAVARRNGRPAGGWFEDDPAHAHDDDVIHGTFQLQLLRVVLVLLMFAIVSGLIAATVLQWGHLQVPARLPWSNRVSEIILGNLLGIPMGIFLMLEDLGNQISDGIPVSGGEEAEQAAAVRRAASPRRLTSPPAREHSTIELPDEHAGAEARGLLSAEHRAGAGSRDEEAGVAVGGGFATVRPCTSADLLKRFKLELIALVVGLFLLNFLFSLPSFFLDWWLSGKVSDGTLTLLNTVVTIVVVYTIYRVGACIARRQGWTQAQGDEEEEEEEEEGEEDERR